MTIGDGGTYFSTIDIGADAIRVDTAASKVTLGDSSFEFYLGTGEFLLGETAAFDVYDQTVDFGKAMHIDVASSTVSFGQAMHIDVANSTVQVYDEWTEIA